MQPHREFIVLALLVVPALSAGCGGGGRRTTGPVPGVAPLSEPEFDRFVTRIVDRTVQVLRLRGDAESVRIAAPTVAGSSVEPADTTGPFAANLAEAMNDRLIGVARVVAPAGGGGAGDELELAGAPDAAQPPPLRTSLSFATIAAEADGMPAERVVRFSLVDARDGAELFRESFAYAASAPPAPRAVAAGTALRTGPRANSARSAPPPRHASPPPPAEPPRAAETTRRDARGAPHSPPAAPRASRSGRGTPREAEPTAAKKERIRIDRDEDGLAAFLHQQWPHHRERSIAGLDGSVLFVDDSAWRRFRLLAQRSVRTDDGRLRVELDVRARDKRRNAKVRIVLLDERGQQVEASPVIPERFMGDYTRTVLFASAGTRATRYIVLFADD